MKLPTIVAVILLIGAASASAQPMSGNYTVGGTSPNFVTPQDAVNALKANGVSGPVFINIRPGTYTRDGGASRLFRLDSIIAGVSPTNRVTFQPDAVEGGTVDNVILQADFNSSSNPRILATVHTDYTTLRDLTFKDADSMDTPVDIFIYAGSGADPWNLTLEGFEVDGCKFIGTPYHTSGGGAFGTDIGFQSDQNLSDAIFTNNRFYRICRGITNANGGFRGGTIIVEDNEFYQGFRRSSGAGDALGTAIEVACTHTSIKRNIIDMAGGCGARSGIEVIFATTAIVERNLIKNRVLCIVDRFIGIQVRNSLFATDSIIIVNNAIVGNQAVVATYGMDILTPNTKILYNTIVNAGGGGGANIALNLRGDDCTVLNNLILEMSTASFLAFDQGISGQAQNLVSDYNVIFLPDGHGASGLVRRDDIVYSTLAAYQAATGLDTNSVSMPITFADGFHLDTCQAQDPLLIGIPVPDVTVDYDGAPRDSVKPFKGADESLRIPYDMFADPFRAGLPGTPFSLAAGDFFDNDGDDDIAMPDYDNRQILLFRNLRPSRSFVQSGTVFTTVQPTVIKLFDLNDDGRLDLIVGGDTAAVEVLYGMAGGGWLSSTRPTLGRVRSIEAEPYRALDPFNLVWITEDNGFLPTTGFLEHLINARGGVNLTYCVTPVFVPNPQGSGYVPDTISTPITDLVVGNIDATPRYELVALGLTPPSKVVIFHDREHLFLGGPGVCFVDTNSFVWPHTENEFGTASYLGHNSSIVMRDFDGDGDNDILATSASENSIMLLRNQGNLTFSVDTIPAPRSRGLVALDYDGDNDLDFVTTNRELYDRGITVFLNDGLGHFIEKPNCFFPFASGFPNGIIASDFDGDNKTDIAIASSFDSLFVLYNLGGFNGTTGVEDPPRRELPTEISLSQNYPNPFNPTTTIKYQITVSSHVSLKIYNILGQELASLVDEEQPAGTHTLLWNGKSTNGLPVSSGVYFYRLEARESSGRFLFASVKKMLALK